MSRLEPLRPEVLDAQQTELYEQITGGPRGQGPQHFALTDAHGALRGPFNALLLSPALGGAYQQVGAAVRYRTALSPRVREIAILTVAAHWASSFEREAHESIGRAVGLTDDELRSLRDGGVPELADSHERACAELAHAMAVQHDVDDAAWEAWAETVGATTVFELAGLVGYYAALALQLRVFRAG